MPSSVLVATSLEKNVDDDVEARDLALSAGADFRTLRVADPHGGHITVRDAPLAAGGSGASRGRSSRTRSPRVVARAGVLYGSCIDGAVLGAAWTRIFPPLLSLEYGTTVPVERLAEAPRHVHLARERPSIEPVRPRAERPAVGHAARRAASFLRSKSLRRVRQKEVGRVIRTSRLPDVLAFHWFWRASFDRRVGVVGIHFGDVHEWGHLVTYSGVVYSLP